MLTSESTIEPRIAESQERIAKPGKSAAQIFKTAAFTKNRNNPKVIIVIGSVRNTSTGQRIAFASPITSAARSADKYPRTSKPETIFDVRNTARPETNQLKIKCVVLSIAS